MSAGVPATHLRKRWLVPEAGLPLELKEQHMRKVTISVVAVACAVGLWACGGAAEIRIDETKGVPPVKGTTEVNLASFTCGTPITAGDE